MAYRIGNSSLLVFSSFTASSTVNVIVSFGAFAVLNNFVLISPTSTCNIILINTCSSTNKKNTEKKGSDGAISNFWIILAVYNLSKGNRAVCYVCWTITASECSC